MLLHFLDTSLLNSGESDILIPIVTESLEIPTRSLLAIEMARFLFYPAVNIMNIQPSPYRGPVCL
jgi:hypothetical protein